MYQMVLISQNLSKWSSTVVKNQEAKSNPLRLSIIIVELSHDIVSTHIPQINYNPWPVLQLYRPRHTSNNCMRSEFTYDHIITTPIHTCLCRIVGSASVPLNDVINSGEQSHTLTGENGEVRTLTTTDIMELVVHDLC